MKKILWLGLSCLLLIQSHEVISGESINNERVICVHNRLDQQLLDAKTIAKEAGKKILEIRNAGKLVSEDVTLPNGKKVRQTNADIEASQTIFNELSRRYPSYGFISQDQMDKDSAWYTKSSVWIVNPIDGTKEFEKGKSDFHVKIGLVQGNESVLGVSYYPATDTYVWAEKGQGAWLEKDGKAKRLVAVSSPEKIFIKSSSYAAIEPYFKGWGWTPSKVMGEELSTTGRLLTMIRGEASLYISLGASPLGKEKKGGVWNYGANAVIANEAGLILSTLAGNPINLRQPDALLVEGIVLTNDPDLYEKVIESNWHLHRNNQ